MFEEYMTPVENGSVVAEEKNGYAHELLQLGSDMHLSEQVYQAIREMAIAEIIN